MEVAPPAKGSELKSLKVVGMRMITEVDKKLGVRPFNWDAGYTISLLAELPGSVLNISDKSAVTKAMTTEGVSLIRGDGDWERRLGFPELSTDKASVLFNLDLKVPPPGTTGIKELSGILQYRVAGGSKEVDLGLKTLTAGTKSDTLGASIEKVKEGWQKNGSQDMEIKLKLKPDDLKTVNVVVDGIKTELTRGGYSNSGDVTTFTFNSKTAIPENGNIVVEVFDAVKSFDVPFKLENLTLLGAPAGK